MTKNCVVPSSTSSKQIIQQLPIKPQCRRLGIVGIAAAMVVVELDSHDKACQQYPGASQQTAKVGWVTTNKLKQAKTLKQASCLDLHRTAWLSPVNIEVTNDKVLVLPPDSENIYHAQPRMSSKRTHGNPSAMPHAKCSSLRASR